MHALVRPVLKPDFYGIPTRSHDGAIHCSLATLLQFSATQKVPDGLDPPAAKTKNPIVEHKSKIAITGNDVHFFSNWQVNFANRAAIVACSAESPVTRQSG